MDKEIKNDDDLIVCRCEEVTVGDIKRAIAEGAQNLDAVKRMTRAGAGLCQSKTCYNLVAQILHNETKIPFSELIPFTVRPPVRPIAIKYWSRQKDQ